MDKNDEFIHVDEEQTPQPGNGQAQVVSPSRGYHWVERSLSEVFVPHMGKWFLAGLIYSIFTTIMPLLGYVFATIVVLLNPIFLAGGYIGANKLQRQTGDITPYQFFEGFLHERKLALIGYCGLFMLILMAIVFAFMFAMSNSGVQGVDLAALQAGVSQGNFEAELQAIAEVIRPYLIWMFIAFIGISLASWFAPNLILFHNQNPASALANSFIGGIKNILPLIVMFLVIVGLFIVLLLVLMVVSLVLTALLPPTAADLVINTFFGAILMPVMVGIGYMSYREVYLGDVKKSQNSL